MTRIVDDRKFGDVYLFEFDKGIFDKLRAKIVGDYAYLPCELVPPLQPPLFSEDHGIPEEVGQPMPGIPIIFVNPDESVTRYDLPCVRITREDPSPALERWMSVHLKYRMPAEGANPITVNFGGREIHGYDKYEEQDGAFPFDIPYTITVEDSGRRARTYAQIILKYVQKKFPPYATMYVEDDRGEGRSYNVFVEGPSDLGQVSDIRDRTMAYALSLRVSAEFDLSDPRIQHVVTDPRVGFHRQ